jgi:hypothetical protein
MLPYEFLEAPGLIEQLYATLHRRIFDLGDLLKEAERLWGGTPGVSLWEPQTSPLVCQWNYNGLVALRHSRCREVGALATSLLSV